MQTIGVKIASERINIQRSFPEPVLYEGYWRFTTVEQTVIRKTGIQRKSEYDAERDAILNAKEYSTTHGVQFITEGYVL